MVFLKSSGSVGKSFLSSFIEDHPYVATESSDFSSHQFASRVDYVVTHSFGNLPTHFAVFRGDTDVFTRPRDVIRNCQATSSPLLYHNWVVMENSSGQSIIRMYGTFDQKFRFYLEG